MKKTAHCDCYMFGEKRMVSNREKIIPYGKIPIYKTKGAAAADVCTPFEITIPPHTTVVIPLWIGFEIPEGYCIKMYPRSSLLVKRGLMQPVSIIDSDFSGNKVHCPVHNLTNEPVVLEAGERIAQVMLEQVIDVPEWVHENNERSSKGFGGSGRV